MLVVVVKGKLRRRPFPTDGAVAILAPAFHHSVAWFQLPQRPGQSPMRNVIHGSVKAPRRISGNFLPERTIAHADLLVPFTGDVVCHRWKENS